MRLGLRVLLALIFISPYAQADSLRELLKRPLILGADLSSDEFSRNPVQRLVRPYSKKPEVMARAGATSRDFLPSIEKRNLKSHSVVMALDLFNHDAESSNVASSVKNLKRLVEITARDEVPLVLGEIPVVAGRAQPGRAKLNFEINRLCRAPHGCFLVPLAQLQEKISQDQGLMLGERDFTVKELYRGGSRVSEPMAAYLTEGLQEILGR
jgi:hypothetical protein